MARRGNAVCSEKNDASGGYVRDAPFLRRIASRGVFFEVIAEIAPHMLTPEARAWHQRSSMVRLDIEPAC